MSRGSTDVVSFEDLLLGIAFLGGRGFTLDCGWNVSFYLFIFFNVLLARQLLTGKGSEVHLLIGRALISRTHAAPTTAAPLRLLVEARNV